ncbi:MAG TPA: TlpA disulfide reductase family protein [Lacipirellulaceae bacterium]|jgi:thiol-disulfide isomerase/thioredoxin
MTISRSPARSLFLLLGIVALTTTSANSLAAPPKGSNQAAAADAVVSDKQSPSDPFAVPDGSTEEILSYIEKIAHPQKQFASQDEMRSYFSRASASIGAGAEKVLAAAASATDKQVTDAIEWKVESLHIKTELGDDNAAKQTADFLDGLKFANRPTLADNLIKIHQNFELTQFQTKLGAKLRAWPSLSAAEHSEVINQLGSIVKAGDATPEKMGLLIEISDVIGEGDAAPLAGRMLNEVLPAFRESKDPNIIGDLPLLEGIARRLNLPGHKLELSGTYLDGKPLDWEAYRGKVVLVDFWATWCGPCRAEVPNVLENYRKYHDKGFDVLGISLDEKRSDVEQYMKESGVPWRTTFFAIPDPQHKQAPPMALKYGVSAIPRCILVDQKGNVVNLNARGNLLSIELQKLLGGPAAGASSANSPSEDEKTAQDR